MVAIGEDGGRGMRRYNISTSSSMSVIVGADCSGAPKWIMGETLRVLVGVLGIDFCVK